MAEQAIVSAREEKILGIIETARSKRARFRDERITMAHGAGGKASLRRDREVDVALSIGRVGVRREETDERVRRCVERCRVE